MGQLGALPDLSGDKLWLSSFSGHAGAGGSPAAGEHCEAFVPTQPLVTSSAPFTCRWGQGGVHQGTLWLGTPVRGARESLHTNKQILALEHD